MPSGFQQDVNQLQPNFYRVAIDMTGYPTADANNNGGITPNSADSFGTLPTTLAKGKQRARGNMRFRNIVNRLSGLSDCQILDVTITEANGDAQATALAFTVKYERDAFIPVATTTADAIKAAVAQGIIDATTATMRVYDGIEGYQLAITVASPVADLAAALTDVTVTLNSDTTLVNA